MARLILSLDGQVHAVEQIPLLASVRPVAPVDCWLKVDTGMARLGIAPADVAAAVAGLRSAPAVRSLTPRSAVTTPW